MPRRKGQRRMDAAIEHLTQYGFLKPIIRQTVMDLLKVYGNDSWLFLEENSYRIVVEKLLEEEDQQQQQHHHQQQEEQKEQQGEAASQVPAASELVNHNHVAVPREMPDVIGDIVPGPARVRTRPPCYGWISESDSDDEMENGVSAVEQTRPPAAAQMNNFLDKRQEAHLRSQYVGHTQPTPMNNGGSTFEQGNIPNAPMTFVANHGGSILLRRRRPSRWDVPPPPRY